MENIVSDDVLNFINDNTKNSYTPSKIKKSNHDILGRKTSSSYPPNFVIIPEKHMDVDIAFLDIYPKSIKISGRYEIQNGEKKYWFKEKAVSENEYFTLFNNNLDKNFSSPGYRASLTATEIRNLLNGSRKIYIDKVQPITNENFVNYDIIFTLSEINTHAHSNDYKGEGIGIFFDEEGKPKNSNVNTAYYRFDSLCISVSEKSHATGVATVLQKTAPKAFIYGFCNFEALPNPFIYDPNIMIGSHSWSTTPSNYYTPLEYQYDSYTYNYRIVNFFAAGNQVILNEDFYVKSPALTPNVIAVGAISPTNSRYKAYSRHINPNTDIQKPEVANYAEFIFPNTETFTDDENHTWNGRFDKTSAATPYTAGITADLFSQHPFFKGHPELVKAHFLAAEKIPIVGADDFDEDNSTVAKGIATYSSLAWNHRLRYWNDENSCCFDNNNKITFTESGILSNSHYRIAISWLTHPNYILNNGTLSQDIDLRVYQNNRLIAYSNSSHDPFEVVDFITSSNADLTIEIERYANSGDDNVILGYSFWNDI
ncbi:MAG: S8 family serine peptidase [Fibrobacter sp.]|nr:S8 family serine peptidase [Fibrobacter sp.]